MFNDQRHMTPGHTRHHRRIAHSQGLVRGITFFCAVLVVILVMRMFVVSLIRASQRRREIERQIQEASQRQQGATVYEDNNELNEL
jgi:heme/copper-type cytochrome/quinol oxidase subunit 2